MKYFSSEGASFINFNVIFHFVLHWGFAGLITYVSFRDKHMYGLIVVPFFMFFGINDLHYRWLLFKYNKTTTLSIDTDKKIFTYKHGDNVITFNSSDVGNWWKYERGPVGSPFVEIIEIQLKNGEKVIISSGLKGAVYFLCDNSTELGLPEQHLMDTYEKSKSFQSFIDKISE